MSSPSAYRVHDTSCRAVEELLEVPFHCPVAYRKLCPRLVENELLQAQRVHQSRQVAPGSASLRRELLHPFKMTVKCKSMNNSDKVGSKKRPCLSSIVQL